MWWLYALLSAFFASLVTIFGKLGLKNVDTNVATTIRSLVMFIFLLLFTLLFNSSSLKSLPQFINHKSLFIVLSGLAGAASWLFYFLALKNGWASRVASIDRLSLLFIVLFSSLFLGETFSWKLFAGSLLLIGGTLLITL